MNVKPEIFQTTKQTILKNKRQFIEIQLGEVAKRILTLKNENSSLKTQIKQLKTKSNEATANALTTRENQDQNKQNKNSNLLKLKNRGIESEAVTHRNSDKQYKDDYEKQSQEIKQLELTLSNEQKQRQKQLAYLQNYIKMLKKMWEKKQSRDIVLQSNVIKPDIQVKSLNDDFQTVKMAGKSIPLKKTIRFIQSRPEKMMISTQSLNESQIEGYQNSQILFTNSSLNNSNFVNHNQQTGFSNSFLTSGEYSKMSQQPKRKTMSLSLNNSKSNQMMGFKFGKKSSNRNKDEQNYENEYIKDSYNNSIYQKQMRPSSVSISFPRDPTNQIISHENSVLNHSNSRTSMSAISNTGSNKSTMRRTQASKSYAKIVTKLKCQGCTQEYRPNQYYTHIEDCRQYLKLKLLQEKERIQDEINQTLNLSISHF